MYKFYFGNSIVTANPKSRKGLDSLVLLLAILIFQPLFEFLLSEFHAFLHSVSASRVQRQHLGEFIHVRFVGRDILDIDFLDKGFYLVSNVFLKFAKEIFEMTICFLMRPPHRSMRPSSRLTYLEQLVLLRALQQLVQRIEYSGSSVPWNVVFLMV